MNAPVRSYYRPDELAVSLKVSRKTVYAWIKQQRIVAFKIGSLVRIPADEYVKIMRSGVPPIPLR